MISSIVKLFCKDCSIELRTRESLVVLLGLATLLSLIASFGVTSASINPMTTERIFPAFWWMIFLFSATVSTGRSLDFELESGAIERVLLSGVSVTAIYFSKLMFHFLLGAFLQIFALVLLAGLTGVPLWSHFWALLLVAGLVILGYTALAIILAALTANSKLKSLLLPLVLIPLLFPLLMCGLELSNEALSSQGIAWDSAWITFVIVLDVIYIVLGINLYPFAIKG